MIITIDGPAGAGKSSVAKILAKRLGFDYLDTGAMYRSVTWSVLRQGIDPLNSVAVAEVVQNINIRFHSGLVYVDQHDVTRAIRSDEVTANVSPIADNPEVRTHLVDLQRAIAQHGNFICEGRDQGTVVFPNAFCKFFLIASAEERAKRRFLQLEEMEELADFDKILQQQNDRDARDYNRPVGKLLKAEDAIEFSTDNRTLDEVADMLVEIIEKKLQEVTQDP